MVFGGTRRSTKRRLRFETLEGRSMLSAAPGLTSLGPYPVSGHSQSAASVAESSVKAAPIADVSSNWSGYAVSAGANSVTYVAGSWSVPTASTKTSGYSSVWVGIDGFSSTTVEQIGTEADVANGKVTSYAWYEAYPAGSVTISSLTVKPGDAITASVAYNANNKDFVLTIIDSTESETYTKTLTASAAARSSAEWVVEAPSSSGGVLPLANFASVTFTNAYATINGTTGPIDNAGWAAYSINMSSRSQLETSTSALSDSVVSSALPTGSAATYSGTVSGFTVTYSAASTGTSPSPTPSPIPVAPAPPPRTHHWGGWGWGWR
jgi:hypothetical protein